MEYVNDKHCASCSGIYPEDELMNIAGYDVCPKCQVELHEAIIEMIHKYQKDHKIHGHNKEAIAMDLLLEVVANDF